MGRLAGLSGQTGKAEKTGAASAVEADLDPEGSSVSGDISPVLDMA